MDTPLNRVLNLEIVSINTKEKLVKLRNTTEYSKAFRGNRRANREIIYCL
ncbi:MAG: hypothetical protein NZ826_01215 [Thermodesulfovibrio sp.]|nr:hypothetical protein [Thermodesulfovibrio sp.]